MTARTVLRASIALCLGATSAVVATPDGRASERGFPAIKTFVSDLADVGTQNFDIVRDARGVFYLANNAGVLTWDGAWWRLIPIGEQASAFSVAANAEGRIGVGGVDTLGVLEADAAGVLRYRALDPLLPAVRRGFGQVLRVYPTPHGFLFLTATFLAAWDGAALRTLATFPGDRPFTVLFDAGATRYVWGRDGLGRLDGERIVPVPGGEVFRGRRVDLLLPMSGGSSSSGSDALLVSVRGEGLFRFAEGTATPFAPEVSRWAVDAHVLDGMRLPDGRFALGSVLGGLALVRPDGAVDQIITTRDGLPDDFVYSMALDADGNLWLALNRGVVRLEVASELSLVDQRSGLRGMVYRMARHQGTLYVATAAGLFALDTAPVAHTPAADDWGRPAHVHQIPGIPPSAWSLLPFDDELLVGDAFGLYRLRGGAVQQIREVGNDTVYALARSRRDPARVWVGLELGLGSLYRVGGDWRFEGLIPGAPREIRTLAEDAGGRLYCESEIDGIVSLDTWIGPRPATLPRVEKNPIGHAQIFSTSLGLLASPDSGLLRLDPTTGRFVSDPALAHLAAGGLSRLAEDASGNLWMNTSPVTVALRRGSGFDPQVRSLVGLPARDVEAVFAEDDGVVWLGGDHGLARYAGAGSRLPSTLPAPLLSRIALADAPTLFGCASASVPQNAELPARMRRLRVEFAPLTDRPGLRYQTRLEPLDAGWSETAAEPFVELTRLPAGSYTLHVRTSGPNAEASAETVWAFRVLPAWYATRWAWALWIVIGAALVRTYGPLRHRALRQRAAALETQVAEKTTALRHTVEELEVANRRLQELSLSDDLTGIANRRRLQQRLDEEWSRARRHQLPIALAMIDLDEFKLLNDTRGHLEGDQALQTVAAYLAEAVQRRGDVVARYGGEEFAVLLPTTELAGVRSVAEALRLGIEDLAIPHPQARRGRLTASIGYAACVPTPEQAVETLIAAADDALYRAKAGGRNRVEAAPGKALPAAPPA